MKQQYVKKILDLSKNLTTEERNLLRERLDISEFTLTRYLSGDIRKLDLADRVIEELTKLKTEKAILTGEQN